MSADVDTTPQPFNLDAILREFNVDGGSNVSERAAATEDELTIARVRESLGLGRSLFRRKASRPSVNEETDKENCDPDAGQDIDDLAGKSSKPTRRIIDSDDDQDETVIARPRAGQSSHASPRHTDTDHEESPHAYADDSDSDDGLTASLLADFRKARLEALSAKVAAKARTEAEAAESAISEPSQTPARSVSRSPSPVERKQKAARTNKKALEEMHRETQRMTRNMALRPELRVAKKIDMNSIFAKFGFKPKNSVDDTNQGDKPEQIIEESVHVSGPGTEFKKNDIELLAPKPASPAPAPNAWAPLPNPDDTDSDDSDSLPSPSKLGAVIMQKKPPQRVQFILQSQPSDSDSDVEIIPPRPLPIATPDRKRLKRTTLIRSLANIKSPMQSRSPGRITQKELDETLSREAALQAAKKREERKAELKSLGIDTEKIIEKRDLLEEAREEARRVREEEGGEESDEEYVDEENFGDVDDDDDDESMEETESNQEDSDKGSAHAMSESEGEDASMDEAPIKRKGKIAQIAEDDEDDIQESQSGVIPESTVGSQASQIQQLADLHHADNISLTQFFNPTQISESAGGPTQVSEATGMTQFFRSTALDEVTSTPGEDTAHSRMNMLRQQAGRSLNNADNEFIGFLDINSEPEAIQHNSSNSPMLSDTIQSPIRRRILKRRPQTKKSEYLIPEDSEEFREQKKEFIEEQAEESEDDYRAWGSGDESENENMDGVVEGLIDDETKIKKNAEQEIARLYLEDELERDEKFVQGLMNDLQNGGLKRRRGRNLEMGDWDTDEDDDDDAEERRRRWELKREEMKRRMLEDENLGKLAANPKTQAFLNAISSTALNFDDEPDFLGEGEIIEDNKAGIAARNLPNSVSISDSQSQSQDQTTQTSAEIQVPATSSGNLNGHGRDRLTIEELTQIEDSQPILTDDISLSEASESDLEDEPPSSFTKDKVYTGFIDRAAQKRAARTLSESATRFAFKAVKVPSPAQVKRTAVSVIDVADESTRKKIMKEVVGSKIVKRKAWGITKGRGAVTYNGPRPKGKENEIADVKREDTGAEKRRKQMLMLMDSQNSFC